MEQAVMNELYYFTDLTGAYVQETISMVSNEILVFGFTALILIVFIRYYLQMLMSSSCLKRLLSRLTYSQHTKAQCHQPHQCLK